MDNKGLLIVILTIIIVSLVFVGAFYIINQGDDNNGDAKNIISNDTSNVSDVKDDNGSDVKNATLTPNSSSSSSKKKYDDWQKDYETGLYDEYGAPIYRSVISTSGGQYEPGIYEAYWSENGPINETRIG